jgi:hypothetical protein
MKIEITGWTTMEEIEDLERSYVAIYPTPDDLSNPIKVTLTYEVDRKVEISETLLRDCFDSFRYLADDDDRQLVYDFYEFTRQKLFGGSDG